MTITTCPKCGSMNITTASTCANCGWSQFAQVTVSSGVYKTIGELEIKMSGKVLLDDYKRLLFENKSLESRIAELEEKQRWRVVADGELPEVYRDEDGDFIPFLVCEGDGGNPFIAMYNGINWWAGIFVPDVTHWMPLPELPEVQE